MKFPATFNVTSLNGKNGFAFINDLEDKWFGEMVSNVGDINQDGKSDVIVASTLGNHAYVVFGADRFPSRLYTSSLNGTSGFIIIGESQTNALGYAVGYIGDINGDGINDLSVGSGGFASQFAVQAYVIFGAKSFPPRISLANLDGRNGFKIIGNTGRGFNGAHGIGDINGDSRLDFILGNVGTYMDYNVAFVIYGAPVFSAILDLSKLNGKNGFTVVSPSMNYYGAYVSGLSDFNGDLKSDFAIGLPWIQQTVVIFGNNQFPAIVDTTNLNGTNGLTIYGMYGVQQWLAEVGDINEDNVSDLGIGSAEQDLVFLIFGGQHFNATFDVSTLNGSNGVTLVSPWSGSFGGSLDGIKDYKGKSGVVVGAPQTGAPVGSGNAFVFFISNDCPPKLDTSNLNGTNGFEIVGRSNALLGSSVAGVENFTGTGGATIIIGAPGENTTYVIFDASTL